MIGDSTAWPFGKRNALLAIAVGGFIAGVLALLFPCILHGWDIPLAIAEGLVGPKAEHGGCWHLCPWCLSALLYRLRVGGCVLRGKPQTPFLETASAGVRLVLRRHSEPRDATCRLSDLRVSRNEPYSP